MTQLHPFPKRDGTWWQVGEIMRHDFAAVSRSEAVAFSKNPRPYMSAVMAASLASEVHPEPVVVSASLIYAISSAWVGSLLADARPSWVLLRINDGMRSGEPFSIACVLGSSIKTMRRYKGVFAVEVAVLRDKQYVAVFRAKFRLTQFLA